MDLQQLKNCLVQLTKIPLCPKKKRLNGYCYGQLSTKENHWPTYQRLILLPIESF